MKGTQLASDIKYYLDYSKWNEELQRAETWPESVKRVMDMHRNHPKFQEAFKNPRFNELFDLTEKLYLDKTIIGSMRALQFGGAPLMKHNSKMFNCLGSNCDRPDFFQEAMYWLMSGCGVGYSVQERHVYQLPTLKPRDKGTKTFIIDDSIEGWADAFGVLMHSYFRYEGKFNEYHGYIIHFDYSLIRPKGAMISGGFKAPGPDGLKASIEKVEEVILNALKNGGILKPINCYDIVCHMADAVLSGGVRRSATICLFSKEDNEMMSAKDYQNFDMSIGINKQRARSNNSVVLLRSETSIDEFTKIFEKIKAWGEPGFYFVDNLDQATNPCVEIGFWPYTEKNESGWQGCLTKDNLILTKEGYQSIENLLTKDKIEVLSQYKSDNDNIDNINHSIVESTLFSTGIQDVYELESIQGLKIKATSDHKFLTKDNKYIELQNLNIGDKLVNYYDKNNQHYPLKYNNFNKYDFLGWIIGDGFYYEYGNTKQLGLIIGSEDDKFAEEKLIPIFEDICRELEIGPKLNDQYFTRYINKDGVIQYTIHGKKAEKFKEEFNLEPGIARDKKFPKMFWELQKSDKVRVLSGLYCSDGSFYSGKRKQNVIELSLSNPEFGKEIYLSLSELGIVPKLRIYERKNSKRCKTEVKIIITGYQNIRLFNDHIGFKLHPIKQNKLDNYLNNVINKQSNRKSSYLHTIKNIKYIGREEVFDLNVPNNHNFVVNGIITHNCNLSSINGGKMNSRAKLLEACIGVAVIGTLQAAYTDFKYVSESSKEIFDREALLGCSITGWMNNPEVLLDEQNMRDGAQLILQINEEVAKIIGIKPAARATCVKPEGNTSVFLENASGCHGEHDEMYLRLMQINKESEIAKYLNENNPDLIEESVWSSNKTDDVVYIPVIPKKGSIYKKDLLGIKQLEIVKKIQANWVEYGTRIEACVKPFLRHNVSNTVTVDNWDETKEFLFENKEYFSGVSFMGNFGDRDYKQAPFTSIHTPDKMLEKYGHAVMFASGLIVDGLYDFDNDLWDACNAVINRKAKLEGTKREVILKKEWIRRAKQFSKRYFKGDINNMVYCLKDLHLYHKWVEINRELKPIDFSKINLKPNYTDVDTMGSSGCVGGVCEIPIEYLEKIK